MNTPSRTAVTAVVITTGTIGWSVGGYVSAAVGLVLGMACGAIRWWQQPLWSWLAVWLHHNRPITWSEPVTVTNDCAGGGVRIHDGVAVVAVQVLGKAHAPTLFTGSTTTSTENTVDVADLVPLLHQSLGLTVDSLSLLSAGARRRCTGDYPRLYDTLIGVPPYAGQRETWLVARIALLPNAEALRWRHSVGSAALAVAQRIGATLRQNGIRAKVATATDITEMERRLGYSALGDSPGATSRRWRSVRSDAGWLTTYRYQPGDITAEKLAHAWSMRADAIIQNVTVFGDGKFTATVTVRNTQPPTTPPSVLLTTLPGEQAQAIAANLCGPTPRLRGVRPGRLGGRLSIPVGPSGVLLGKVGAGDRLMMPLDDPGEFSRVHIAADDALSKRIVLRLAGAGELITVHTRDHQRWGSLQMPGIAVSDAARPVSGTTVSVVDGTLTPAVRPNTVISVGEPGAPHRGPADVVIVQTGPATVQVSTAGSAHTVEIELFRAEDRYVRSAPGATPGAAPTAAPEALSR